MPGLVLLTPTALTQPPSSSTATNHTPWDASEFQPAAGGPLVKGQWRRLLLAQDIGRTDIDSRSLLRSVTTFICEMPNSSSAEPLHQRRRRSRQSFVR